METRVALIGSAAVEALPTLKRLIKARVVLDAIPDPIDSTRLESAVGAAQIVVSRRWPSGITKAPHLRLIHHIGAGVDAYQREALPPTAYLCNVFEHEQSIAEHVFMVILALRRSLFTLDRNLRRGLWGRDKMGNMSPRLDLKGLTLGIVGFGHIGRALLPPAKAFNLQIIGITGHPAGDTLPDGVSFLGGPENLDRILKDSDIIVLAVPLNERTRGLIGEREFGLMRRTALLINVARGPIIAEDALYNALHSNRIAGAAIDVWYQYPSSTEICLPSERPIHQLSNVILTPHVAGWSNDTIERRWEFIARNIDRVVRGERPFNIVWEPRSQLESMGFR